MKLNLIETLKTSIYNPEQTKSTKIYKNAYFKQMLSTKKFSVLCWFEWNYSYCWGPHSLTSFILQATYFDQFLQYTGVRHVALTALKHRWRYVAGWSPALCSRKLEYDREGTPSPSGVSTRASSADVGAPTVGQRETPRKKTPQSQGSHQGLSIYKVDYVNN